VIMGLLVFKASAELGRENGSGIGQQSWLSFLKCNFLSLNKVLNKHPWQTSS
jgi:hypothetical protein